MTLTATCLAPAPAITASSVAEVKRLARIIEPAAAFGHVAYRVPTGTGIARCVTRLEIDVPGGRVEVHPADVSAAGDPQAWHGRALLLRAVHAGTVRHHVACDPGDLATMLSRSMSFAATGA